MYTTMSAAGYAKLSISCASGPLIHSLLSLKDLCATVGLVPNLALFSAPLCLMVAYLMLDEVFVHGPTGRGFGSAVSEASRDLR